MAFLIKADNTIQEVKPKTGPSFTLEELQGFVGGLIELVTRLQSTLVFMDGLELDIEPDKHIMFINEEGKLDGLPVNTIATALYQYGDDDAIVGDVVVCTQEEAGE